MNAYLCLTFYLHFWQNDRSLLRATAVTREWNEHHIRESAHKVAPKFLKKKIILPLVPGFELATFRSRARCSNQQAIPAPPPHPTHTHTHPFVCRFEVIPRVAECAELITAVVPLLLFFILGFEAGLVSVGIVKLITRSTVVKRARQRPQSVLSDKQLPHCLVSTSREVRK